jgi:hypothetical protein
MLLTTNKEYKEQHFHSSQIFNQGNQKDRVNSKEQFHSKKQHAHVIVSLPCNYNEKKNLHKMVTM